MELRRRVRQLYEGGRMYDALEAAQSACEQQPKDPDAWWLLGCVCRHTGMPAASDHAFAQAAWLAPERLAPPIRLTADRFRELMEEARPLDRAEDLRVEPLPDGAAIAAGLSPDALWSRLKSKLVFYQSNHENRAGTEADLRALMATSWKAAAQPR